jgi:hypothetical protein
MEVTPPSQLTLMLHFFDKLCPPPAIGKQTSLAVSRGISDEIITFNCLTG